MSGQKQIKVVLHAPQKPADIEYLQNVHNELVAAVLRNRLQASGASRKEKTEYLTGIIKTI
jgi:hypothetical protein